MRSIIALGIFTTLASCGAIGTPVVTQESTAAGDVTILPIDASSVRAANAAPYAPKTLPAIFSRTTGAAAAPRGFGALPDAPLAQEPRPKGLTTRLPPAYTPGSYRIGVGDVVVLASPQGGTTVQELTGLLAAQNRRTGYTVQDDGAIAVPDIGRVKIGGMTLEEAETAVFDALVSNRFEPSFALEVAEFRSQRVSIGGAVNAPGVVPITMTALTLSEAINLSGGVKVRDLDYASIRLYRNASLYQIPLETYLRDPAMQKINLRDGDSVYIDTEYDLEQAYGYFEQQLTLRNARMSARASALDALETEIGLRRAELNEGRTNFTQKMQMDAVDRDYVYIAGEVERQSRYTLPFERQAHLADALFDRAEGVPNATGNIGEVYVLRGTGDGRGIQAWHLDAHNAANLVLATRFELRPGDVIFVSERPLTAASRVISQVAAAIRVLTL